MDLWSVDQWQVRPEAEQEFLALLREHSVGGDRIFRDLEDPHVYWVPRHWESRAQFEDWHANFVELSEELIASVATYPMVLVAGE
jgi:hypothetical protein